MQWRVTAAPEGERRVVPGIALAMLLTAALQPLMAQSGRVAADDERLALTACVLAEHDYVRAGGRPLPASASAQFVLVEAATGAPLYSVTGTREPDLASHAGRRIAVRGVLESWRQRLAPTSPSDTDLLRPSASDVADPPRAAVAHEPGDGANPQEVLASPTLAAASDPVIILQLLPRLRVTAFEPAAGECVKVEPAAAALAQDVPRETAGPRRAAAAETDVPRQIVVLGCVAWQTPAGDARGDAKHAEGDRLILTSASVTRSRTASTRSAVPGSLPSGSGSGTVENGRTASGSPSPVGFALAATEQQTTALVGYLGQRVEIVGRLDANPVALPASPAGVQDRSSGHPSSAAQRLTVSSFRPIGGTCR